MKIKSIVDIKRESDHRLGLLAELAPQDLIAYKAFFWDSSSWQKISEVESVKPINLDGKTVRVYTRRRYAPGKKHELYTPELKGNPDGFRLEFATDVIGPDDKMVHPKKIFEQNPVDPEVVARYKKFYGLDKPSK